MTDLPHRPCLVLYRYAENEEPCWIHVVYQDADGETTYDDIYPTTRGHNERWVDALAGEVIDPADCITWAELPTVPA
jgi:hypothetical protein